MKRIEELDTLRGIAIILMIIYHFFFDLAYLGVGNINIFDLEWQLFQRVIGTMFVFIAGVSIVLSESRNNEGYIRHAKRGLKLAAVALLITLVTWIFPHKGFIMFGIIHFIAAATFIAPFFFRFGRWNLLLGLLIILLGFYVSGLSTDSHYLFWLGIIYPGYQPLDHYSMIPWFGVILIGIYAGQTGFPQSNPILNRLKDLGRLAILGRNSLLIYLIHQPIMFGAMLAYLLLA